MLRPCAVISPWRSPRRSLPCPTKKSPGFPSRTLVWIAIPTRRSCSAPNGIGKSHPATGVLPAEKASATRTKGLIIVNTGPGKGKTTAALGIAFRALGQGMKVGMVQFIKGAIPTGEAALVKQLHLPMVMYTMGDGFTWNTQDREQDMATARQAWEQALTLLHDAAFDMVILDELNIVLRYGYLPLAEVLAALRNKRPMLHVVITGRNASLS